jgi:transcriptional regulator with XRE-family HTH domain
MLVSHVISVHYTAGSTITSSGKRRCELRKRHFESWRPPQTGTAFQGIAHEDLAQAVGCDESMISKIEAGKVMPSLPMLNKMVHALDRDMASFFGPKIDEYKLVKKPNGFKTTLPIDLSEATVKTIGV